jgi:hypothetical protein
MSTHSGPRSEPARQAIPVHPATGPKTARVNATPAGRLRRTLGGTALFSLAMLTAAGYSQPADAQAAVVQDMPGVVTTWYYPEDWGYAEPNPNCEHGLNQLVSTVTSRWTTSLCRVGDPQNPGFYRYYNINAGPQYWFLDVGHRDGYVLVNDRDSWSTGCSVWFRYPENDVTQLEISVTPQGQTQAGGFEPILQYIQASPQDARTFLIDDSNARGWWLWLQTQIYGQVADQHPYISGSSTASQNTVADQQAQTNITRINLENTLATDPTAEQFQAAADMATNMASSQADNIEQMEGQPQPS